MVCGDLLRREADPRKMESEKKAKVEELKGLSARKAEMELRMQILEAELVAVVSRTRELEAELLAKKREFDLVEKEAAADGIAKLMSYLEDLKSEKAPLFTLTGEQVMQREQWQNDKAFEISISTPAGPAATIGNFGNYANYAHWAKGEEYREGDWDWNQA